MLAADDRAALAPLVDRAAAAGELRASSDPDPELLMKLLSVDPSLAVGAFQEGGLVGFACPDFKLVVVEPDRRRLGIGRALVDGALATARTRGQPELILGVLSDDVAGLAFLRAMGFREHSTLWLLDLPRDVVPAAPAWPPGMTARPFDGARDVDAWIALFNEAFADHATPLQLDRAFIVAGLEDPAYADEDIVLVEDDAGRLLGFCATTPRRAGRADLRAWRDLHDRRPARSPGTGARPTAAPLGRPLPPLDRRHGREPVGQRPERACPGPV